MTTPAEAAFVAGLPRGPNGELSPGHTTWQMLGPQAKNRYARMAAAADETVHAELAKAQNQLTSILSVVGYAQHNEALQERKP